MNKQDVIAFFDRLAPQWDGDTIRSDVIIGQILDNAGVKKGCKVLDVACGTGVLFPDYLAREVREITGVDISSQMVRIAREKFPQDHIQVLCADVEEAKLPGGYDCVMVYNAFPHFPDPDRLLRVLSGLVRPGGTVTVAHGMSRAHIDAHHSGAASKVSIGLLHEDALEQMMETYLDVTVKISNENMYQVTGIKK